MTTKQTTPADLSYWEDCRVSHVPTPEELARDLDLDINEKMAAWFAKEGKERGPYPVGRPIAWDDDTPLNPSYGAICEEEHLLGSYRLKIATITASDAEDYRATHGEDAFQEQVKRLLRSRIAPFCIAAGHMHALTFPKDPTPYHQAIARGVLEEELKENTPEGREVDALARALLEHLQNATKELGRFEATIEEVFGPIWEEEMLWLDARAARFLEKTGPWGKEAAALIRTKAKERREAYLRTKQPTLQGLASPELGAVWSLLWAKPSAKVTPLRFAWYLARVLWHDLVVPKLNKGRDKPKALAFPILQEAINAHTPGGKMKPHQGEHALFNHRDELVSPLRRVEPLKVPTLELSVLPQILRKGSKLLGTLNSYRLLHLEVSLGHQRALDEVKDFRALRFEGGWAALAEAAGIEGNSRGISEVHAIIAAQAHLCWVSPDGTYGNLLSYEVRPARRNQRSRVSVILGDALLPDFIFSPGFFGNGRKARESRRLVPMLPLPPLVGRDKDKAAQVNLQLRLVAEMRKRAGELYEEGGILVLPEQWQEFAEDAVLPLPTLDKVIDRWTRDGDDGPALLECIEEDRYTLTKTYQDAKDFLTQAGKDEIQGREAGLKSRERDRKR